ncbi:MAG: 23S rRNA (adenine(2503)-C(2))-methyltransferase RlmN [Boseongicola sp. SB0670_bin_30]|nr:23S rRNA (adenine(2503)-C(2))-methyltransferase RlmN [Boseongicola sp. SB0670_bin_30]
MAVHAPITPDVLTVPRKDSLGDGRINLVGLTWDKLSKTLVQAGTPERQARMRSRQIWQWMYHWGVRDFTAMTNLSKAYRAMLQERFVVSLPKVIRRQVSSDGTRKLLIRIAGGHEVETVYIPEEDRGTLCISSQVGCTLTCSFCHTGTQKLVRNLTPDEIVGQVMLARDDLGEWPEPGIGSGETGPRLLSNVVLMGMGEPLYNFDAVRDAMKIVMDGEGIALSRRRITLSTSGVVPEIARTATEIGCMLAVSFHATTDEVRNQLVPINRRWNIVELLDALRAYPKLSNSERITFEYVMLKGVNDSDDDARRLVKLIRGIPAKVNLIPFNAWPGAPYERSDQSRIKAFADIVHKAGYASPVRTPRGEDIMAACGQLKSDTERARKSRAEILAQAGLA